jgi:hypothetical protein
MTGNEAGEDKSAFFGEAPDKLVGPVHSKRPRMGVVVLHTGMLLHLFGMRLDLLLGAEHELVIDKTFVGQHEPDRLALSDLHMVGPNNMRPGASRMTMSTERACACGFPGSPKSVTACIAPGPCAMTGLGTTAVASTTRSGRDRVETSTIAEQSQIRAGADWQQVPAS